MAAQAQFLMMNMQLQSARQQFAQTETEAREQWKKEITRGLTEDPFQLWARTNYPMLQSSQDQYEAAQSFYDEANSRQGGREAEEGRKALQKKVEDERKASMDREGTDEKFLRIRRDGNGGMSVEELREFVKDQKNRVPADKKGGMEFGQVEGFSQKIDQASESELQQCSNLLFVLVP
ncbi:hypothetical protein HII31_04367 [Pseudocercospora fuligena]|uniref:Uncharacterized protein n=1 Tax=Pseudocercospora fuligena TaxID=685502 RepID=A0A8H6RMU6_9PEZI|nr:hypothetical protein HII31_04367 [Pseudocercospora fuligena]